MARSSLHDNAGTLTPVGCVEPDFTCLYSPNTSSNFTNEELWEGTAGSLGLLEGYWVETGGAYGYPNGNTRYWFWADNRMGYGYTEHVHLSQTAKLNTDYDVVIYYAGNNDWIGTVNGNQVMESVDNGPDSWFLNVGTEITAASGARSVGSASFLGWQGQGTGDGYYPWDNEPTNSYSYTEDVGAGGLPTGAVTTTSWVEPYSQVQWATSC